MDARLRTVLSATGCTTVAALAQKAGVSRSEVYRALEGLAGPGVRARLELKLGAELAAILVQGKQ